MQEYETFLDQFQVDILNGTPYKWNQEVANATCYFRQCKLRSGEVLIPLFLKNYITGAKLLIMGKIEDNFHFY